MEVTYLWPPWLSGRYHPRCDAAAGYVASDEYASGAFARCSAEGAYELLGCVPVGLEQFSSVYNILFRAVRRWSELL
jgi:hypothetical protein